MKLATYTITVINKKWDDAKGYDVYARTVIRGVSWHSQMAATVDSEGLHAANTVTIRIPIDADFSGKAYVDPLTYKNSDPARAWTLSNGDFIVRGVVMDETINPATLKENYAKVITVLSVTDNRGVPRGRHFKVVGE